MAKLDVFGEAIEAYYKQPNQQLIKVHSPDFEDDEIEVSYLFRNFNQMPKIEQKALQLCRGTVLDVGCGAGSHSLYLQNQKKLTVHAIDTSLKSVQIAKQRGITSAENINFFELNHSTYDTLLFMMNGIGIAGKLSHLHHFFEHSKRLLKPQGQLILDSSDLYYLYEEVEEDVLQSPFYYGEMHYQISYLNITSSPFSWLYIDFKSLSFFADLHGFKAEKIMDGPHYDYLARLTLTSP